MLESSTHNVSIPNVSRSELQCIDIDDEGFMTLLLESGDTRSDIQVPDGDVGKQIQKYHEEAKDFSVTILKAIGRELAIDSKVMTNL